MLKKRFILIALVITVAITFTGCWDQREFSDIAVVMGITVDVNDEENYGKGISVGVQVANPVSHTSSGQGSSQESYSEFSDTGNNIFEILRSITHLSSRRLYNSHNQIVVFGSELAEKQGIGSEMDFLLRDNEMRYSVLLAVAEEKASDILAADTNYEHVPAQELAELIKNQAVNSGSVECNLLDFVLYGTSPGSTALMPVVKIKEASESDNDKKNFEVNGAAVFNGDIMVGKLTERETRGALWVRDKVERGIIECSFEGVDAEIEVFSAKTFVEVSINSAGKAKAVVRCEIYANIAGLSGYEGLFNEELEEKISIYSGKAVEKEIFDAWEASKKMGCDVFCFGNMIYKKAPKDWSKYGDNWQQIYNDMEISLNIDINVEDVGDLTGDVAWKGAAEKQ